MATSNWVKRLNEIHPITGDYIKANTDVWYNARRGRLTASKRAEIIATGVKWPELAEEVASELEPGWSRTHIDSVAMKWGRDNEPRALGTLELETGYEVSDPGLVFHPDMPFVAATPDGMYEQDGKIVSVQIKCPFNPKRHLNNLYSKTIDKAYWFQVQWEAWLLGADSIVFASYDPRQPLASQLAIIPIEINIDIIRKFDENAVRFEAFLQGGVKPAEGRLAIDSGIPELF